MLAHAMRRNRPGRTVAVRMLRTSPRGARIIMTEIPCLAGEDREPTPGARHQLAGLEPPPPLSAHPTVRRAIAALATARTLMVTHNEMVTTIPRLIGDEDGAEMVGATPHSLVPPGLPVIDGWRGRGRRQEGDRYGPAV